MTKQEAEDAKLEAYRRLEAALDVLDYHVGVGNLTDDEGDIYEAAQDALRFVKEYMFETFQEKMEQLKREWCTRCDCKRGRDGCSHP